VPDTIADRAIVVKMSRKLTTETCLPLADLDTALIKAKCLRFALDNAPFIASAEKTRVEGLNDRAADTFDPLYVIARLAGEAWEKKLHTAALALAATDDTEKSGSGLILDIIDIFLNYAREKIFTRDLITLLRDGGIKSSALKYTSINEYQISKILRAYDIRPMTIRIGVQVSTGYVLQDFREALGRYVSRADAEARIADIKRRAQLQIEAHTEAAQQRKLMETMRAGMKPTLESDDLDDGLDNFEEDLSESGE
jgi:hypothetical protein